MDPAAGKRLIGVSLFFAAAILASAWLHKVVSAPGAGVVVIVVAGLVGGWLLNKQAQVQGLPLAAAIIMSAVAGLTWFMGWQVDGVPPGSMFFMALLLSIYARSWAAGIVTTATLAGAEVLTILI